MPVRPVSCGVPDWEVTVNTALMKIAIRCSAGLVLILTLALALALVGAGLATLYLRSRWDELTGKTLEVTPAIVGGEAGLTARIRF